MKCSSKVMNRKTDQIISTIESVLDKLSDKSNFTHLNNLFLKYRGWENILNEIQSQLGRGLLAIKPINFKFKLITYP